LGEGIVAGCKHHDYVKQVLPRIIQLDHKLVEEVPFLLSGFNIKMRLWYLDVFSIELFFVDY
jgi:hypothetical protein